MYKRHVPLTHERTSVTRRLVQAAVLDDDALADEIVECAHSGERLNLCVFLNSITDLSQRPVALDAAIEVSLLQLRKLGASPEEACEQLVQAHPQLASPIRTAHLLGQAMASTASVAAGIAGGRTLALPCSVGPRLVDGRPRYDLHQLIGVGSQGSVYLALDRALSDTEHPAWVAVKRLHMGPADGTSAAEALRARRVLHRNVTRVLDRFTEDDRTNHLVFEYVRGGSLESWRRGIPDRAHPRKAVEIVLSIARGVQAAHAVGVIHRDLKPSNILIDERGEPKVTDFGIAVDNLFPASGGRLGSLAFIAPEQFAPSPGSITTAADIYALGGILFWLLCDEFPNGSTHEQATKRLVQGVSAPELPPRSRKRDIDVDVDAICRRALSADPANRYASADAFASDLECWLRREPIRWTRPAYRRRVALAMRRAPGSFALALLVALLAGLATILSAYRLGIADLEHSRLAYELQLAERDADMQKEHVARAKLGEQLVNRYFRNRDPDSIGANWTNAVTFLESVLGPTVLLASEDGHLMWDRRIEAVRGIVDANRDVGRDTYLESLLWETTLAMWLARSGQAGEASERLRRVERVWKEKLDNDDPWIDQLEVLVCCADALSLAPAAPDSAAAKQALLAQAEAALCRLPSQPAHLRRLLELARSRQ